MGLLDDFASQSNVGINQMASSLRGYNPPGNAEETDADKWHQLIYPGMMRQYPSFNPQSWAYALSRMPESQNIEDRRGQPNLIQATKPATNEPLPAKMQEWYKQEWENLKARAARGDLDAQRRMHEIMTTVIATMPKDPQWPTPATQ